MLSWRGSFWTSGYGISAALRSERRAAGVGPGAAIASGYATGLGAGEAKVSPSGRRRSDEKRIVMVVAVVDELCGMLSVLAVVCFGDDPDHSLKVCNQADGERAVLQQQQAEGLTTKSHKRRCYAKVGQDSKPFLLLPSRALHISIQARHPGCRSSQPRISYLWHVLDDVYSLA